MKEQDIRQRDVHNRYLELVRRDSEELFRDKSAFQAVDCPACACPDHVRQFVKFGFTYDQCNDCDTLFVNPRPNYGDLVQFYSESPSTKFWIEEFFLPMVEARREKIFRPRAEFAAGEFPHLNSGRIADIGAGFGLFLEELKKIWPEAKMSAIEPSSDMAKICGDKGFHVIPAMLEAVDPVLDKFHLVTAFELFEHLLDPLYFLKKIYGLLDDGGILILTTLNGLGFDIQLLWENSKSIFPPHHLNFFNPHSMEQLLERAGFKEIKVTTPGQLDWDIIEGGYFNEGLDPGRFFRTVAKYGKPESKAQLQAWIKDNNFSSHMRIIAKK